MLDNYAKTYRKTTNQILIINKKGIVEDFESILFKDIKGKPVNIIHPFFETVLSLIKEPNQHHTFKCVNLNIGTKIYTIDSELYTNEKDEAAVFVFSELTQHYRIYQKVAQLRNEAALKSQLLEYQNLLISEKERFKNDFITNFSHEIRLPINTIAGLTALLENTNLKQDQRYNLNVIKNTNDKLKAMVDDILDISKIETGHFNCFEKRYHLLNELELIKTIYSQRCKDKGLDLIINIHKDCPDLVVSDKYRMAQIASNLISNAIKFTSSGTVRLSVKPKKNKKKDTITLQFTVEDTGVGIPKDKLKYIFKSFYQIENTLYNNGYGLGLAITKNLVAALGGKIKVESEINKGTKFNVLLPFKIPDDETPEVAVKKNSKETKHFDYKILVAEPLAKNKIAILKILNKTKKYDVVLVETGDEVIEELHKQAYDLVILNLKLPTMDGLDTARYIRFSRFPQFSKIPIIAVSENPSVLEEKMCKDKKINSYLGMPYNKAEALRKVKYCIKKRQTQ